MIRTLAAVFFQILGAFPVYLREVFRLSEDGIGLVLAWNTLLIILFEMVLTHAAERHDAARVAGVGAFLVCLGFGLLPFGTSIPFLLVTVTVWSVGEMLALPMTSALVASRAGEENLGRYMGAYGLAFSSAWMVAPVAGLTIYDLAGGEVLWHGVLLFGPLLLAGFFALARGWNREGPRSRGLNRARRSSS